MQRIGVVVSKPRMLGVVMRERDNKLLVTWGYNKTGPVKVEWENECDVKDTGEKTELYYAYQMIPMAISYLKSRDELKIVERGRLFAVKTFDGNEELITLFLGIAVADRSTPILQWMVSLVLLSLDYRIPVREQILEGGE